MNDSAARAVLTAAVEQLFKGHLPSEWVEYAPFARDLGRHIQPAIAIRFNEDLRRLHWRQNNKARWRRDHPGEPIPESVENAEAPPRHPAKSLSIAGQERAGRSALVRKTLSNKVSFQTKTEDGVEYIRLIQVPQPLRSEQRFKIG